MNNRLYQSFFLGGFECSTHRLRSGKRLDILAATRHDELVVKDYQRLQRQGIRTARDGVRWHLIEQTPGRYDWRSVLPMVRAAQATRTQVIWDLCHYGWPDDLDIFKPAFVRRFGRFARAFARLLADEMDMTPFVCPINEISFFAWGGGDVAYLNPFQHGRGMELKAQLVLAAIEAIEAVWEVAPHARIVHVDPLINVIPNAAMPEHDGWARGHHESQFEAWEMLTGRRWPLLGGDPKYLDIVGVNYYHDNQWIHLGEHINRSHPLYRPFHELLRDAYERFQRPLFVAETGTENEARPDWLRYIGGEVRQAIREGVPVEGVCLYPIVNHPGWDDERHCHNGLWDYADEEGEREIYGPLAWELHRQQRLLEKIVPSEPAREEDVA